MRNTRRMFSLCSLCSLFLLSKLVAAQTVACFPVQGTNLEPGVSDAIGVVFAEAYAQAAGAPVLSPSQTAIVLAETGARPAVAQKLGATEYLEVTAVRLDTRIILHATRLAVDGKPIFQSDATATSLDDIEVVVQRLAAALVGRMSVRDTLQPDNVMGAEAEGKNRVFSEKVMGVKTTLVLPFAADFHSSPLMSLQFDGRLEARSYFLEFGAGFLLPSGVEGDADEKNLSYGGVFVELGASYYLGQGSISPYVGAGVIPSILSIDNTADLDGGGGVRLATYAQLGLMFFRESSSRLYAEVRVAQHLLPFQWESYDDWYTDDVDRPTERVQARPTEVHFAVGIGW